MSKRKIYLYVAFFLALQGTALAETRERIQWSGFDWYVRKTTEPEGPMDNLFGGIGNGVDILSDGALRLSIVHRKDSWYAAEIWTRKSLGYGTYTFHVRTSLGSLHPDLTLGLFTYSQTIWYHHREIDIEFSSWGENADDFSGQYVIQPYEKTGNIYQFPAVVFTSPSTQQFIWLPDRIEFASWLGYGERPATGDRGLLCSWVFMDPKSIPKPSAPVHMNLYVFKNPPSAKKDGNFEVIVDNFTFTPAKK